MRMIVRVACGDQWKWVQSSSFGRRGGGGVADDCGVGGGGHGSTIFILLFDFISDGWTQGGGQILGIKLVPDVGLESRERRGRRGADSFLQSSDRCYIRPLVALLCCSLLSCDICRFESGFPVCLIWTEFIGQSVDMSPYQHVCKNHSISNSSNQISLEIEPRCHGVTILLNVLS